MIETVAPLPSLRHLARLSDALGIFEHAKLDRPRPECGYCTDDAGRLLAIACRLASDVNAPLLAEVALGFLERAHVGGGRFRLRQGVDGTWTNDRPSDDSAGRALLGLGTAVARAPWPDIRDRALVLFGEAADFRSEHPRAVAYAGLGAVEVLQAVADHGGARRLVSDAADSLPSPHTSDAWPWPEPRLSYANALVPNAALAVATAMGRRRASSDALHLLEWLVDQEMVDGHFSFTPVGGRGRNGPQPAFDQQPIEACTMTEACARAFASHGRPPLGKCGAPLGCVVPRRQRRRGDGLRPGDRWRLRRSGARGREPQRGGGVDPGVRGHDAPAPGASVRGCGSCRDQLGRSPRVAGLKVAACRASSSLPTSAVATPTQRSAAP